MAAHRQSKVGASYRLSARVSSPGTQAACAACRRPVGIAPNLFCGDFYCLKFHFGDVDVYDKTDAR